jgi:cob(I)alamin adenosyltransferase
MRTAAVKGEAHKEELIVMVKIYTKTGDTGETGLWGGKRISKDDVRIHAYGTIDECNAVLGLARSMEIDSELDQRLETVQNQLFVVGADLASPGDTKPAIERIGEEEIAWLENEIDRMEEHLEPLKQFILPGGSRAAAYLHLARTVCRRAERWTVRLAAEEKQAQLPAKYLNRLSDFLFVCARTANLSASLPDTPWQSPRKKKKT